MIYEVHIVAPAVNEMVTTSADNEEQARVRAVESAFVRLAEAARVTVTLLADGKNPNQS